MPSTWLEDGRTAERNYFFQILGYLETEWLVENIDRIRSERTLRKQIAPPKPSTLMITNNWAS
jgi:hypothetical protein